MFTMQYNQSIFEYLLYNKIIVFGHTTVQYNQSIFEHTTVQ